MTVADSKTDQHLIHLRAWPTGSIYSLILSLLFAGLSVGAAIDHAYVSAAILGGLATMVIYGTLQECAWAMSGLL